MNGVVHTTIGTVERISDTILCEAESILMDDHSAVYKKVTAAVVAVPYAVAKVSAVCARNATDFAARSVMRLFR